MEFSANDSPQDRELKIQIIQIYNSKLDERERRKNYLLSRGLLDYRKNQIADAKLPRDEKDLIRRMRIFERLHSPEEHKTLMEGILKAKRLRKEIAKLQMYRRMGITTLAEAEKYELDKNRREFHKMSQLQKEAEKVKAAEAAAQKESGDGEDVGFEDDVSSSLWKQYRTSDRKYRRSVNRNSPAIQAVALASTENPIVDKKEETKEAPKSDAAEADVAKKGESTATEKKPEESDFAEKPNFAISKMPGYDLLSKKEVKLCIDMEIRPAQYIKAKRAIIQESFNRGFLDKTSSKRSVVKIDIEKKGKVIDFIVKAGWIPTKIGESMKT